MSETRRRVLQSERDNTSALRFRQYRRATRTWSVRQTGRALLGKPTAPMLVIGGALDTQVPVADIDLLLRSGETPKDLWLHPRGGHMGRDAKDWPDPAIFKRVTAPWLTRVLSESAD